MNHKIGVCSLGLLVAAPLLGCGGSDNENGKEPGNLAETELAITTVPAGVQCVKVVVSVAGQTVTVPLMSVVAGNSSATLSLGLLPAGNATFQGSAYNGACSTVTNSTVANWVSDPVTASLSIGFVTSVSMNFRQNNPVSVSANFSGNVAEVYTSIYASYARMGDGTVTEWGGTGIVSGLTPTAVPSLSGVVQVAGGNSFACARKTDGTVWCWGYNANGSMGPNVAIGTMAFTPVQIPGLSSVTAISAGFTHVCAISQGTLYCWGGNAEGELGNGTTTNSSTPVSSRSNIGTVAAGGQHTCVTDNIGGNVMCTGFNASGQLGNGTTTSSSTFVSSNISGALAVSASFYHTCVLGGDNTVRCFGGNGYGNLGDGTTTNRLTPTLVPGLTNVLQIQAGYSHTCALISGGTVSCWGSSAYVGTGQSTSPLTPVTVPGLSGVTAVHTTQGWHTCVEFSDHSVKCWGQNSNGQVGDGTMSYVARPTPVWF